MVNDVLGIGLPIRGSVSSMFLINFINILSNTNMPHTVIYDMHFNLAVARNRIVKKAQDQRVFKLFFIDSDVYPYRVIDGKPSYFPSIIKYLYDNYKDYKVVCVNHYSKKGSQNVYRITEVKKICANKTCSSKIDFPVIEPLNLEPNTGLHKVDVCGMGITMIDMDVFNNIDPPWFKFEHVANSEGEFDIGEDVYFFTKLKKNKIDVYATTDVLLLHEMQLYVDAKGNALMYPF